MKRGCDPAAVREAVAGALRASGKHGRLSDDTLDWAAAWAVERASDPKDAEKRAKRKLHQIAAGFADHRALERARRALAAIAAQASGAERDATLIAWRRDAMALHASTAERLPSLERVWSELAAMADLASARTLLDVGCGLNPLARPWMGLDSAARYDAVDIDGASIDVVADCAALAGEPGNARRGNAVLSPPTERVDVAILLKTLNNLDQQSPGAGEALLQSIPFDRAIVSYPARTLGGRDVGMKENYRSRFEAFLERVGWRAEALDLGGELYFVVRRGEAGSGGAAPRAEA